MDDHPVFKIEEKKPHRYGKFRFFIAGFAILQGAVVILELGKYVQPPFLHPIGFLFYMIGPSIVLTLCYFAYRFLDDVNKAMDKQDLMINYLSMQRKKEEKAAAAPPTSGVRKLSGRETLSS